MKEALETYLEKMCVFLHRLRLLPQLQTLQHLHQPQVYKFLMLEIHVPLSLTMANAISVLVIVTMTAIVRLDLDVLKDACLVGSRMSQVALGDLTVIQYSLAIMIIVSLFVHHSFGGFAYDIAVLTTMYFIFLLGFLPTSQPGVINYVGECSSSTYLCGKIHIYLFKIYIKEL